MRRLIGISGATASGKTTIAKALIEHFSADTRRFSHILAAIAKELSLPTDKPSLQHLSTTLRSKLGEDVLARGMCEWIKSSEAEVVIIEGLRREVDVLLLEAVAQETGRAWTLLYIDVPTEMRFARINARLAGEGNSPITREAFEVLDRDECEIELPRIEARAHHILDNGSLGSEVVTKQAIALI